MREQPGYLALYKYKPWVRQCVFFIGIPKEKKIILSFNAWNPNRQRVQWWNDRWPAFSKSIPSCQAFPPGINEETNHQILGN
jgi:hypothetical protein